MSVFVLAPNENWICDRFVKEWKAHSDYPVTDNIFDAKCIWLLADWCWNQVPNQILQSKKVIASVHHIVPEKFDSKEYELFKARDTIVDLYHVPCNKTKEQIKKYTNKPIWVYPFWVNSDIWFPLNKDFKDSVKEENNISKEHFLIGSFQRDTEGHDLISPKLEKGPDLFCDAVDQIRDHQKAKDKEVSVILAGWRRQYVMNRLNTAGINFHYFELPNFKKINELYNILDLYVVAARYEGGPQAIVECAACEIPIVSTDVGLADMILHDDSIFKPGDVLKAVPNIEYAKKKVSKYFIPNGFKPFIKTIEGM